MCVFIYKIYVCYIYICKTINRESIKNVKKYLQNITGKWLISKIYKELSSNKTKQPSIFKRFLKIVIIDWVSVVYNNGFQVYKGAREDSSEVRD